MQTEATTFILVSFEGPDRYSLAGGLGVRVAELSRALADAGHQTHVLFVGDPFRPAVEVTGGGRLVLHRWCQWLSKYYPRGVYEGEEAKLRDFNESAPRFIVDELARPALAAGHRVVVMGEEWHTAEVMCRVSDLLHGAGLRSRALLLWNANNTMSFSRINWGRLDYVTTITTVSRYMKHLMWSYGVNPLVIPNGIPRSWLHPLPPADVTRLRASLGRDLVLTKVARWDPDKRWMMAIETVAALKAHGHDSVLIAVGGVEPHQGEVLHRAQELGLVVRPVTIAEPSLAGLARAFADAGPADVLNVRSFVPPVLLRPLYAASDAVLVNSGREPFGLVGLEAMAAGAVAFTGGTGEEYAVHLENAIVLETSDAEEAAWYIRYLERAPSVAENLSREARRTARRFLWDGIVDNLLGKVEFLAMRQGMPVTELPSTPHVRASRAVPATPAASGVLVRAS